MTERMSKKHLYNIRVFTHVTTVRPTSPEPPQSDNIRMRDILNKLDEKINAGEPIDTKAFRETLKIKPSYICFGGPLDGQRVDYSDEHFIYLGEFLDEQGLRNFHYTRDELTLGGRTHKFYRLNVLNTLDCISMLFSKYGKGKDNG